MQLQYLLSCCCHARLHLLLLLLLLACAHVSQSQTAEFDIFSVPTLNQVVKAGTLFDIRWYPSAAPLDGAINISLIHGSQGSLHAPATLLGSNISVAPMQGKWTWSVPGPADWTASDYYSPVYVVRIQLESDSSTYSLSPAFNISGIELLTSAGSSSAAAPSSTSSSSPSSAAGTTSSPTAPTAASATATPSISATAAPAAISSSSGLSTGAKAGIAVGTVLFVAILAGLLFLFLRRRRQAAKPRYQTGPHSPAVFSPQVSEPATATTATATSATIAYTDAWLLDFASDAAEKDTTWRDGVAPHGMHELEADHSQLPAEADSTAIPRTVDAAGRSIPAVIVSTPKTAGINDVTPMPSIGYSPSETGTDKSSESNLEALETRLEKVRQAKERLKRLPELEELEKELKEEIMREHRRLSGTGAGSAAGA